MINLGLNKYIDNISAVLKYEVYMYEGLIEALCPVNVLKFPYDTQICRLTFGSWVFNGFDLNVYSSKKFADISSLKENVEWVKCSLKI
jgi:nicotinic acetylcholine receptor alpha-9